MFSKIVLLIVTINYLLLPLSVQAKEKTKIGFLFKTMQEDRYEHDKKLFEEKAKSLNAEVLFESASNNAQTQSKQFSDLLAQGCQVIVLQPVDTNNAERMVRMAHLRGVKVVGYDSPLGDGSLDVMVMQDSQAVGREQGKALEVWLKKKYGEVKGKIALIMGHPGDNNARLMSIGICETVGKDSSGKCKTICAKGCKNTDKDGVGTKNPNLELIIAEEHNGWFADHAMTTTTAKLKEHPEGIDAFICNNSGLARGVITALEAEKRLDISKIFIAGSDADLFNVRKIVRDQQNLEIFKKIKPLAEISAQIAVELVINPTTKAEDLAKKLTLKECPECFKTVPNSYMDAPTIVTPIVPFTKENVDILIEEKMYTREQIYNK